MKETWKNYENRCNNGDFSLYLHGKGIDIGGGDDCLVLPKEIKGSVRLWDVNDGDAQYLHSIKDESYDFVYSSHCLEHMRNIDVAMQNWIRICRVEGYIYICVPHEHWYEKDVWPSINNGDHKWSFTIDKKTSLPRNVVIKDFLDKYKNWVDIVDIRENLQNYDFSQDFMNEQTFDYSKKVCAQIDIILKKKDRISFTKKESRLNEINWAIDYFRVVLPTKYNKTILSITPEPIRNKVKKIGKKVVGRL